MVFTTLLQAAVSFLLDGALEVFGCLSGKHVPIMLFSTVLLNLCFIMSIFKDALPIIPA